MRPHDVIQVDAELSEDGRTVVLYGHTRKADSIYIACVDLPKPLKELEFDPDPGRWQRKAKEWVLYA